MSNESATVTKAYVCDEVKLVSADARTIKFTITTDAPDRHGDVVKADGWDVEDYLRNPIVLWSHDYSIPPIARTISMERTARGLSAVAEFPTKDINAFADTIFQMLKGGFLNAASVGFKPSKSERNEKRGGRDYTKQSLLEWSVVGVPANAQALVEARSAGIDTSVLKEWASATLKALNVTEEQAAKPLTTDTIVVDLADLRKDIAAMRELLKPVTVAKTDPDDDSPLVLELADPDPHTFDFEPDQLRAALGGLITSTMRDLVADATTQALRRAQGRVD